METRGTGFGYIAISYKSLCGQEHPFRHSYRFLVAQTIIPFQRLSATCLCLRQLSTGSDQLFLRNVLPHCVANMTNLDESLKARAQHLLDSIPVTERPLASREQKLRDLNDRVANLSMLQERLKYERNMACAQQNHVLRPRRERFSSLVFCELLLLNNMDDTFASSWLQFRYQKN